MSDIKIDTCPICGGHDFSPLAANQYMCTQCGYVVTGSSDSSQAPSPSSDSSVAGASVSVSSSIGRLSAVVKHNFPSSRR